jgi:glycine/D-amino acid oxidase-like deaminating enzyme
VEARRLLLGAVEELGLSGEPHVWQEARVKGIETDRGVIEAETTVIAAGTWSGRLLEPIGFDPCMRPKKRQIFVLSDERLRDLFEIKGFNRYGVLPFTILPKASLYLKAEPYERSVWLGCSDEIGRAFVLEDDPEPELEYYRDDIYPILMKYFPCFKDLRPVNMWAGQYAVNSFDGHPIVDSIPGLIYVGAASGSGIMKCDALGRIVSALYAGREKAELYDGSRFRVSDLSIENRRTERERFII